MARTGPVTVLTTLRLIPAESPSTVMVSLVLTIALPLQRLAVLAGPIHPGQDVEDTHGRHLFRQFG